MIKILPVILGQLLVFYCLPLLSRPLGAMGMVLVLLIITFLLSVKVGCSVHSKIKWSYPPFTAIVFIPSVFLYYNPSALIQSVWYLVISLLGVLFGAITARSHKQ